MSFPLLAHSWVVISVLLLVNAMPAARSAVVRGTVVDAKTGAVLPSRVYLRNEGGQWFFPKSASPAGSAVEYKKTRGQHSVEMHTTLSAHPFEADLPPGQYTIIVERGKEYRELEQEFRVAGEPVQLRLPLQRWINMAERGWFSGDTHVHRTLEELPNLMLAEDLNVAFPLTSWVTRAFETPNRDPNAPAELIKVDDTHVIYPRNTEYEIFTVKGQSHTLGAVFVLGHREVLNFGVPPVKPIAALRQTEPEILLDLDKHNWPWSIALMPLLRVDLFELSNNHVWRTQFGFTNWGETAAAYMGLDYDGQGGSEMGWVRFGLENYYALLNCGFDIQPTAGTASGVHPVPLSFGRVYVHVDGRLDFSQWRRNLKLGQSFVTTGPMLLVRANHELPGFKWRRLDGSQPARLHLKGSALSAHPLSAIEILFNGRVVQTLAPGNRLTESGALESVIDVEYRAEESGWLAVRGWEPRPEGRFRFAHTAPWHLEIPGKPLRPRKEQVEYLIRRVQEQIDRSQSVLPPEAIAEYREALRAYQEIGRRAR